jgi:hypothetical protein
MSVGPCVSCGSVEKYKAFKMCVKCYKTHWQSKNTDKVKLYSERHKERHSDAIRFQNMLISAQRESLKLIIQLDKRIIQLDQYAYKYQKRQELRNSRYIGHVNGHLTVIEAAEPKLEFRPEHTTCGYRKRQAFIRRPQWICKCTCGNTRIVQQNWLKRFDCCVECANKRTLRQNTERVLSLNTNLDSIRAPGEVGLRIVFGKYQAHAHKKNREFKLTLEQFKNITSSNCYYCGSVPSKTQTVGKKLKTIMRSEYNYNGIDRVNNQVGYTIDNCVPCCSTCNFMKRDFRVNEFLNKCLQIADKHRDKNITKSA